MPYTPTTWVNGTTPALNATNLNKLTDELKSQAATRGIANSLVVWVNATVPAISDPTQLNEMERVAQAVATSLALSYSPTTWQPNWVPARNATNLNKLEAAAVANRAAIEAAAPNVLAFAPPVAGSGGVAIVNFTLTDATRGSATLGAGAGRDLVITNPSPLTGGIGQLVGWRHVIWIGGEVNVSSGTNQTIIIPRGCSGIVHVEGVYVHGVGVGDAFVNRLTGPYTTQIQNCRFEVNSQAGFHADCFQCQGVQLSGARWDKCTFVTNYQGIFLRNDYADLASSYINNIDIRRVNFRGAAGNRFWQTWEDPAHPGDGNYCDTTPAAIAPVSLQDVWVAGDGDGRGGLGRRVFPAETFETGFPGGGTATMRRGCFVRSDATSTYVAFSTGAEVVPAGGPKSGMATLDCQITGIIRDGIPPDGDFVPVGIPGTGYVSPGYA